MKYNNVVETIGNTPHVLLNKLFPEANLRNIEVWMKLERSNPGGSIKDRVAKQMIEDAINNGSIKKDTKIFEPTSGNTGIGLALVCAVKGLDLTVVMPESMSIERRKAISVYGSKVILTAKEKGMKGAIEMAQNLVSKNPNSWMPMQFDNRSNIDAHIKTTVKEIEKDFSDGLDYIISGVGTGGHITACAEYLKERITGLKVYAVEPVESPVLSGGIAGPHKIQGIGAGFFPHILNVDLLDGVIQVNQDDAYKFSRSLAHLEGIWSGISSGASLCAIQNKLKNIPDGSKILTFAYDNGERYLSVDGLF